MEYEKHLLSRPYETIMMITIILIKLSSCILLMGNSNHNAILDCHSGVSELTLNPSDEETD